MYGLEYFTFNIYNAVSVLFAFAIMITGSITDIQKREVADFVNYGLLFGAIGLRLLYSIFTWNIWVLIEGFAGFLIFLALGLILFYTGQWGGGDSKMIIGLGMLFGIPLTPFSFMGLFSSILVAFILNSFVAGSFYGLTWSIYLGFKDKKKFVKSWKKIFEDKKIRIYQILLSIITVFAIIYGFFIDILAYFVALMSFTFLILMYLFIFAKCIEKCQMIQDMRVEENPKDKNLKKLILLTEGEWIVKDIKHKGKYICGPKDLGISKEQILMLKRAKISKVSVKVGIPFVPSFLIGFILTMIFGNIFLYFMFLL
jgi:Flp pilus assembly protein protease CpaA